ncbi:glucosaminidase domain-containing protein [Clostridium perfringens]|uniref:glucosaminidase domain-containing protein n=3 Tax=Clostridium perfringens TaxID=1502 RepID=UPI0024BD2A76|nr:glucosaminidase domain-containing protein [Clostridium perfringens]
MKKLIIGSGILTLIFPLLIFFLLLFGGGGGSSQPLPINPNPNLTEKQLNFINQIVPGARQSYEETGIFPSITIAQAILESGWGESGLAVKAKNLFGIKADSSWKGEVLEMLTQEHVNGGVITITARWRVYSSWNDSVIDHGKFFVENSRYKENGVLDAKNYIDQANCIQKAGYATDPNYAKLLIQVINDFGLNIYDINGNIVGNDVIETAIAAGMKWVGKSPYVWGGGRTEADVIAGRFDCSSLVHYCYASAGIQLGPRESVTTWSLINMGRPVPSNEMKRGDLIFFDTAGVNGHVGIYLGDGTFLNDSSTQGVSIGNLNSAYWSKYFNGNVRRIVE